MFIKNFYYQFKKMIHIHRRQIGKNLFAEALTKRKGLERKAETLKILALGSSQCARGFYADLIQDAYNLGSSSQDLYTSYQLLKKYLPRLENLEHVILFYAVFSPGYELAKTTMTKQVVINHYVFDIPYSVPDLSLWHRAVNHRFKKFDDTHINYETYCGFHSEDEPNPTPLEERCQKHIRENQRLTHQTRYVELISDLLKSRNIHFSVVICPCREDYTQFILKKIPEPFIELKHLLKTPNCCMTRLFDWLEGIDFCDMDFSDIDHLNSKGAKKLTLQLANWLNLPIKNK